MRRVIEYSLRQPLFVLLGTFMFAIAGVIAFLNLPVEAFPDVSDTQVNVIALYPGRAAEEVERQVTIPIETALSSVPNMVRMFSHTQFGLSFIILTFNDKPNDQLVPAWNQASRRSPRRSAKFSVSGCVAIIIPRRNCAPCRIG